MITLTRNRAGDQEICSRLLPQLEHASALFQVPALGIEGVHEHRRRAARLRVITSGETRSRTTYAHSPAMVDFWFTPVISQDFDSTRL